MKSKIIILVLFVLISSCLNRGPAEELWAEDILGNPEYRAISFGGWRHATRDTAPSVEDLKEDLRILQALDIKLLRTYNTQEFEDTANLLKAIRELKKEDKEFEMYVMLGAWIQCKDAFEDYPDHSQEDSVMNQAEIEMSVKMAKDYPDIVKIIAVGNEAMVHWAAPYFVHPTVVLKYVNYLQDLKAEGEIPSRLWITSSDNFASWGGDESSYHIPELTKLMQAVDYLSIHTYPFHDSYHNPDFWIVTKEEEDLDKVEQIEKAMDRAKDYAISQYKNVRDYMESLGIKKDIHIGETGWATMANALYGEEGSKAADEYKQALFHKKIRKWTDRQDISCFYFEAFDELWKDSSSPEGSENHFGLFNLDGEAKYAIWDLVDNGTFDGLSRGGLKITKSYQGNEKELMESVRRPTLRSDLGIFEISTLDEDRTIGEKVNNAYYRVYSDDDIMEGLDFAYPSAKIKLNAWEVSCAMEIRDSSIVVKSNKAAWWGCGLELQADGKGEDLSAFEEGVLHFEIKGESESIFQLGFQTGIFNQGTQVNSFIMFGPGKDYFLEEEWKSYSVPIKELNQEAVLNDVTSLLYLRCDEAYDGKDIQIRNIYYSKN